MRIGYARVSTLEQHLDLQIDALQKAGCEKILTDKMSGAKARPGLNEALAFLRPGDVLVVWKLDRLGRRTVKLIQLIEELKARGIGFKSLSNAIDTTTPEGMFIRHSAYLCITLIFLGLFFSDFVKQITKPLKNGLLSL